MAQSWMGLTHLHPIAPNLLGRRLDPGTSQQALAQVPNQVWVCDLTYVPTRQGWLYLWAVLDWLSRKIVGWALTDHMRAQRGLDALSMALRHRKPPKQLMHHCVVVAVTRPAHAGNQAMLGVFEVPGVNKKDELQGLVIA